MTLHLDENTCAQPEAFDQLSQATLPPSTTSISEISGGAPRWSWLTRSRRCLAEAFGVFIIVFSAGGTNITSQVWNGQAGLIGAALASGLAVMAMIYALGHICGAHFNPAVTLAFTVIRRFPLREVPGYLLAQLGGGFLAALALQSLFGKTTVPLAVTGPSQSATPSQAFFMEFILSFFLMFVITSVATDNRAVGQAAALAIGVTVVVAILVGGPVSGASMNPARSFGPVLVTGYWQNHWLYWLGPIGGAIGGAGLYQFIRGQGQDKASERSYKHES